MALICSLCSTSHLMENHKCIRAAGVHMYSGWPRFIHRQRKNRLQHSTGEALPSYVRFKAASQKKVIAEHRKGIQEIRSIQQCP